MVQEWVYKATPTIASLNDTRGLALQDGFLAKAAHEKPNVDDTHLASVSDAVFESRLQKMGYGRDTRLGLTTGWLLKRVDRQQPAYDRNWFPGNHVLRRHERRGATVVTSR